MFSRQILRLHCGKSYALRPPTTFKARAGFASVVSEDHASRHVGAHAVEGVKGGFRNRLIHKGTITTDRPYATSVVDLLDALRRVPLDAIDVPQTSRFQLTVVLTPSYAQHALDADLPLEIFKCLRTSEDHATPPVSAFTAVVDRLPSPASSATGLEGLGYLLQSVAALSNHESSQVLASSSAQKPGFVTFRIPDLQDNSKCCEVQCTLAKTIFWTGRPSTLQHAQYEYDKRSEKYTSVTTQGLEAQWLELPPASLANSTLPLTPLTPFRTVRDCVGNIVRSLSDVSLSDGRSPDQQSTSSQPASQELESAISQYFATSNRDPEAVQVWALIVPEFAALSGAYTHPEQPPNDIFGLLHLSSHEIRERWLRKMDVNTQFDDDLANATMSILRQGGRLCRVLSGGGGWGKKAGLLSLDPDLAYSTRELRSEKGWEFDLDDSSRETSRASMLQQLEQIVKPGEHISFLLADKSKGGSNTNFNQNYGVSFRDILSFGNIPSTIDSPASARGSSNMSSNESAMIRVSEDFGILSENGIALSFTSAGDVRKSKFDVPFARLQIGGMCI